jgi:hypothetical protein
MPAPGPRTTDPDGRAVIFDAGSYLHLAPGERWPLLENVDAILLTVERPDHRADDPRPGRERFYRRNVLTPWRWLRVVVDFNDAPGRIVTAFVQTHDPRTRKP